MESQGNTLIDRKGARGSSPSVSSRGDRSNVVDHLAPGVTEDTHATSFHAKRTNGKVGHLLMQAGAEPSNHW